MSAAAAARSGSEVRRGRAAQVACWTLLVLSLIGTVQLQHLIDRERKGLMPFSDVLYVRSGTLMRHLSLGYDGLLADIYWTRAVQYFGRRRLAHSAEYAMLGPLLRLATELDPHLLIAYRYGAVFLAERRPSGAGRPDEALALLRRGIAANPTYWRLWQDVGFIYYWDLRDYAGAARAFEAGSRIPGAQAWMRTMAATVAAKGGDIQASRLLWSEIYRQAGNDQIRRSALDHLAALEAEQQLQALDALADRFREREGRVARSFQELIAARYIAGEPRDPSGAPYVIGVDGRVHLGPHSAIDLGLVR